MTAFLLAVPLSVMIGALAIIRARRATRHPFPLVAVRHKSTGKIQHPIRK